MTSNPFYRNKNICKNVNLNDTEFINSSRNIDEGINSESSENDNNKIQDIQTNRKCKYEDKEVSRSTELNTSLSSWGLPDCILSKYESRGITTMLNWQAECLGNGRLLVENRNLVYSAPTSAGKTLVAEILALKTVLERQKKVIIILPFVSVVREKMFYFQDILMPSGLRVEGFMGSHTPPGGFKAVHLAICTIEKANSIVNRLLEEGGLADIGAVIIDEIHLLADPSRGYILELLLTKLRYMSAKDPDINIQLIGMSATLPNLELIADWLDADLYMTDFRPIPLYEYSLVMGEIYDNHFHLQRRLNKIPELTEDTDNILQLCLETISISCSVLIFCPTKSWCENLAQQISVAFKKLGLTESKFGKCLREQLSCNAIVETLEQLERCPVGLDAVLRKTVSFGVAFHHAGLTMDERDIIEGAFRSGALRVLVATSTLSSGVNLPAQRVIIRTPLFHGKAIDALTYRQMIGRAGRMGKDSSGESILVCQKNDKRIASELMSARLSPVTSCLEGAGKLNRAILEVIASGVATTPDHIETFAKCTLLFASNQSKQIANPIDDAVRFLETNELIRLQRNDENVLAYAPTALGKACLSSSLPPEDGLILLEEINKARQCFVLDTDLHLLYLVTPYSICSQWANMDWMLYLDIWEKLPVNMRRVADLVGVRESYIFNATRGKVLGATGKKYQIHRRFYTALALQDLVNEVPLNEVAHKFQCSRGMLQSLQQSASMFAGMVTSFCSQLRWKCVEILISQFQDRLQFGIQHELLDLMKLPNMNGPRARALYNAGIQTLTDLASFDVCQLENILHASVPFQSEKARDDGDNLDKKNMRTIWISGKEGMTVREAAQMLISDARTYLQLEMGAVAVKWESSAREGSPSFNSSSVTSRDDSQLFHPSLYQPNENNSKINSLINRFSQHSIVSSEDDDESHTEDQIPDDVFDYSWTSQLEKKSINNSLQIQTKTDNDEVLFEESLNLNSRLCDVLDTSVNEKCLSNSQQQIKQTLSDSLLLDSTFSTCISHDDFEVIKASNSDNSSNIIDTSISETKDSFKFYKTINSVKKKNMKTPVHKRNRTKKKSKKLSDTSLTLHETPRKKQKYMNNCETNKNSLDENIFDLSTCDFSIVPQYNDEQSECVDLSTLDLVPVCKNANLFETFCQEIENKKSFSMAVACDFFDSRRPTIGQNIIKWSSDKNDIKESMVFGNKRITGVAICWGGNTAYYMSFTDSSPIENDKKQNILQKILNKRHLVVRIFDSKEQIKVLYYGCGIHLNCNIEDPKVAAWLLESETNEKNLQAMALKYAPEAVGIAQLGGNSKGIGSISLDVHSSILSRIRSAAESVTVWHIMSSQKDVILEENLILRDTFKIEMSTILCLTRMETIGIRIDLAKMNEVVDKIQGHMSALETRAHQLAGRRFQMTSSRDVAMVLGLWKGSRVKTSKKILKQQRNPISDIIIQWRKLSNTLRKMLYPLFQSAQNDRIHYSCITFTSTGRISMHEPNLQNVPRNYDVEILDETSFSVSVRSVFIPSEQKLFVSADYCQLELRILSHLSKDSVLCKIMRSNSDVFRTIAANLHTLTEDQVNDVQRQHAKQLCYAIIYGMGTKALAAQMDTNEKQADEFMKTFFSTYPSITQFVQETVQCCREVGYVETIAGRRRYLPNINSENIALRGINNEPKPFSEATYLFILCFIWPEQAGRQAVNTTIQGSAADIAKRAMIRVEEELRQYYSLRSMDFQCSVVLHLHDELLCEVPVKHLKTAAVIIKNTMESAITLDVPLPVKLKCGQSWGQLEEFPC